MEAMREALSPMMEVEGQLLATNQDEFIAQQRTNAIKLYFWVNVWLLVRFKPVLLILLSSACLWLPW